MTFSILQLSLINCSLSKIRVTHYNVTRRDDTHYNFTWLNNTQRYESRHSKKCDTHHNIVPSVVVPYVVVPFK